MSLTDYQKASFRQHLHTTDQLVDPDTGEVAEVGGDTTGLQATSEKDQANGYAGLDGSGKLAAAQLPGAAATDVETAAAVAALSAVYQPLDADLTAIAALTTTAYGRALLALADQAALAAAHSHAAAPIEYVADPAISGQPYSAFAGSGFGFYTPGCYLAGTASSVSFTVTSGDILDIKVYGRGRFVLSGAATGNADGGGSVTYTTQIVAQTSGTVVLTGQDSTSSHSNGGGGDSACLRSITVTPAEVTPFIETLLDDETAAQARTTLGIGRGIGEYASKYNPDHETPATTPAIAEEMNTSTTMTWDTAPATTDDLTTQPGYYRFRMGTTTYRYLSKAWAPGATDLTVCAKVSYATKTGGGGFGVFVGDASATPSDAVKALVEADSGTWSIYNKNSGSMSIIANAAVGGHQQTTLYIRLTRIVSGPTWNAHFSFDGLTWYTIAANGSKALTVARVGITVGADQEYTVDWLRAWASIVTKVGA